jgi:type IV pilus assembly protein PilV
MSAARRSVAERGFSLIEVMVSLIVMSAGLLGVAKMQALALASTQIASARSMAAIQAASLASAMHENRGYWGSTAPAAVAGGIVVTYTGIGSSGAMAAPQIAAGTLPTSTDCTTTACSSLQLAGYDLQQWALALQRVLPNYVTTITCPAGSPVTCTININWTEKAISLMPAGAAAQASPNYTLYVQP